MGILQVQKALGILMLFKEIWYPTWLSNGRVKEREDVLSV